MLRILATPLEDTPGSAPFSFGTFRFLYSTLMVNMANMYTYVKEDISCSITCNRHRSPSTASPLFNSQHDFRSPFKSWAQICTTWGAASLYDTTSRSLMHAGNFCTPPAHPPRRSIIRGEVYDERLPFRINTCSNLDRLAKPSLPRLPTGISPAT
jgi:hypothetical protein